MKGPFWKGYAGAVGNLHGWGDGDPFLVNYVAHPMQGAVDSHRPGSAVLAEPQEGHGDRLGLQRMV